MRRIASSPGSSSSRGILEAPADRTYGRLRTRLEKMGQPIGGNDLLIAAQAVTLQCTLVTDNEGEFARIEELRCENWVR